MRLPPPLSDSERPRLCIGLLSGTSADAVEAALCEVTGTGGGARLRLLSHVSAPFPPDVVARMLGPQDAHSLSRLDFELGEYFARAALQVMEQAGVARSDVAAIGSHGQTMAHHPPGTTDVPSTLQIGESSVIAELTGLPVISDFRTRDVAAGGHGAPLVPYFDWVAFRGLQAPRALQNLGGIANVSVVGPLLDDTFAFDTGPGNMVLDGLARRATHNRLACDLDGTLSAEGRVIPELLEELLADAFLAQPPPKSTGRERYGDALVERLWARHPDRANDLLATALELTVESTARAYETWVFPRAPDLEAMYVSGGGTRNPRLMGRLEARLAPLPVRRLDSLGFPEGAKEAALFALLAAEYLVGTPANVPSATGAKRRVVLGKLTP
ncbi:anhydro-N-acetylmuramic acid kinase [Myxococcus sp. K38C18041901]|uniref:anhydro-N-acetylmuramic acid kinase n=1 Tax=Myxococcus guangdongensis TaxID=2906760 RepID=UPI0020A7B70F|nr:anhydro-N-acetylmuramic acid kinase [Myxococcus guangdongensis]MCP3060807.1 anhydro-N-acetylmuramic acid kinase [Myxococcus guangdongensis]